MKIIIAGAGAVGTHLAKLLSREKQDIILMDDNEEKLSTLNSNFDLMTATASPTSIKGLKEVGVGEADLFIAVTPDESRNMTACMLANNLGAQKTVARIDNYEYLLPKNKEFFQKLGVDSLIYPEMLAAKEIVSSIRMSWVRQWWEFCGGALILIGTKMREKAEILNIPLHELGGPELPYHVVAIKRGSETLIPRGDDTIKLHDIVYFTTTRKYVPYIRKIAGKEDYADVRNVMIMGGSRIAVRTAQYVPDYMQVKIVDNDLNRCNRLTELLDDRTMIINGDGRDMDLLVEEGLKNTEAFVALTGNSETNILACLVAKKLGTPHTIARIRNPEYEKQLHFMREELGLSMVVNPEKATAREIARVLRFPSAIKREQFCRQRFELIEYRLADDNPLVGLQLSDLYRNIRVKILICAVARGSETIIPTGMFTLRAGDKIYLTASARDLESFFRKLNLFKAKASNVMIVGASRMTYYLVKELQDIQKRVTVIDSDAARCQEMSEKFPGVLVIHGDGADAELLSEERITDMDAFVALTGLDETNIILAMYASQINSCKVVAKINRESFAELAAAKGMVDSVVSTASVTSESIAMYVRAMQNSFESENIKTLHRLVSGRVEALEFNVAPGLPFIGVPLKDLTLRKGLLVAGIVRRNGQTVIPSGNDALQEGDDVVIVTTDTTLHSLRDIVK